MSDTCANPLLLGWIKEWVDEAQKKNPRGVLVYKKAYESMLACPLVFQHPSEAQQLNGLGPKLCDRLTEKLKIHCQQQGLPMPDDPKKGQKRQSGDDVPERQPAKKPRKTKPYVPAKNSGPYALLLALATLDENSPQALTKADLIKKAQPLCDSSFTAPSGPSKFHTAWDSMKGLIKRELVYEQGRPLRKYALTDDGWVVAKGIRTATGQAVPQSSQGAPSEFNRSNPATLQYVSRNSPFEPDSDQQNNLRIAQSDPNDSRVAFNKPLLLPPGSFTVELILDSREVRSSKDRDYIANQLIERGIRPEVRTLELGDAMWVAKCKDPHLLSSYGEEGDEVMLDWIVERKRTDDLIASIKDQRFHEQKFRLRRSGLKNVIYLIEEFSLSSVHDTSGPNATKLQDMVDSAIATTQVVNGYFVKKTLNIDDTIRYLARMTHLLREMYEPQPNALSNGKRSAAVALIPSTQLVSSQAYLSILESLRNDPNPSFHTSPSSSPENNPSPPPLSTSTITYAVTFSTFSALTSKSDVLSLRDIFLKMLMCTRGITGEKAIEIQRRWNTPRKLIEAFEEIESGPGFSALLDVAAKKKLKQKMLTDQLGSLIARKKVAGSLSEKLVETWGQTANG